jgi:hypothetical protein
VVAAIPEVLFQHCLTSVVLHFTAAGTPFVREATRQTVKAGLFLSLTKPKILHVYIKKRELNVVFNFTAKLIKYFAHLASQV